jgi:hypothetical protein
MGSSAEYRIWPNDTDANQPPTMRQNEPHARGSTADADHSE